MDRIRLKGMKFYGYHGDLPQERDLGQAFEVDIEIFMDLQPAGSKDDLNFSVNYVDVFQLVEKVVTGRPFSLIEAVAERIAILILERFIFVQVVKVTVKKPSAPVQGLFEYMSVEITRERDHQQQYTS